VRIATTGDTAAPLRFLPSGVIAGISPQLPHPNGGALMRD
jgi:hypothetical protein